MAGVAQRAAHRLAMAAESLGQRVDDQPRADLLGLEQRRRRQAVVDDIEDAPFATERADPFEVGYLGPRIGDRLDEHHPRVGTQHRADIVGRGHVDEIDLDAEAGEAAQQTGGVAEDVAARDDMVAFAQQREEHRRDRRHAGGEGDRVLRALEHRELLLERRVGRIGLAGIGVARLLPLEDPDQAFGCRMAIGDAQMDRRMYRAMLGAVVAVEVQQAGFETGLVVHHVIPFSRGG